MCAAPLNTTTTPTTEITEKFKQITKEIYQIREWSPLTEIIEKIPVRVQRGLFPVNLNVTCIDAAEGFLALGSDAGIVFWYNRQTGDMQKLKAEVTTRITCVKIVDSVEFMVAAGSSTGQVSVFQIQKEVPPDLDIVAPCTRVKPIQRYTIRDLHHCVVSCCEWSKNGMKLYSGDRQGVVVLTEFDYQIQLSKSMVILSETYEVVQLSVHQSYLLVATLYRCVVCQRAEHTGQWQITQIGQRERKQLIDCGGLILKQQTSNKKEPLLISGRPGLRFWLSDSQGNVKSTLLFKDAIQSNGAWEIPLLNPKTIAGNKRATTDSMGDDSNAPIVGNTNFRNLCLYARQDSLVVTHDDAKLYILNIERLRVEAVASGFRKILDFCVCDKEIFVLEGERSLLRLAPLPEKPNKTARVIFNPLLPPPVPVLGATIAGSFEAPIEYEPEKNNDNNAEECFELPPIEKLDLNVPIELAVESPLAEQQRRLEIFRQIGEMDFEQSILHTSSLSMGADRKKRKTKTASGIVEIGQEAGKKTEVKNRSKNQKRTSTTDQATFMEASYCNLENDAAATPLDIKAAYTQHLPSALSPTTLQRTIAEKAKNLAVELELPEVELALISDELLRCSQASATPSTALQDLSKCYPKFSSTAETTGVQKTPRKKLDYLAVEFDSENGELVDEQAAAMPHSTDDAKSEEPKLETTEYKSFLPNFERAADPLYKNESQTSDSTNSSEWEIVDT